MTNKRNKNFYIFFLIATTIYTLCGIATLGAKGGPCNAGLGLIVLGPLFFFSFLLLITSVFPSIILANKIDFRASVLAGILSFAIWVIAIIIWYKVEKNGTILHLTPYGMFILISMLLIYLKHKKKNQ